MNETLSDFEKIAVVGVLFEDDQFLVIKRSIHVVAPGKICFPGGSIEAGETEEQALIREFREEVSLDVKPVQPLWSSVTSWRCLVHWWKVNCFKSDLAHANAREVEAVDWRSLTDLLGDDSLLESNRDFLELLKKGELSL